MGVVNMNSVQVYGQEDFVEFRKLESRDLSYAIFSDIDFHKYMYPVSFFRSDFRGSKFKNMKFYKNNFDRSDFLNSVFLDCQFEKVNFGCCQIKNCYFENIDFTNNLYRNTSIHSTTFVNCRFPDESFLINMQRCILIDCVFSGCNFEMSTTDSDEFNNCTFIDTNLATMHAENHIFIKCKFDKVCLDSSYFFGYSIANCNMKNVVFLYHGEYVPFNKLDASNYLDSFKEEHRFNEVINFMKLSKMQEEIPNVIMEFINYYSENSYGRLLEISIVMNTLIFSAIYEEINFNVLYRILVILENIELKNWSFNEKNEFAALNIKFKNALFLSPHSVKYLLEIRKEQFSTLTLRFENDNFDICAKEAEEFINSFSDMSYWNMIQKQQGSWFLTFAVPTVILISVLPNIIKNYADVYFDIKTKQALSNKILQKLNSPNISHREIEILEKDIEKGQLLLQSGQCLNKNIKFKDDIHSIQANI